MQTFGVPQYHLKVNGRTIYYPVPCIIISVFKLLSCPKQDLQIAKKKFLSFRMFLYCTFGSSPELAASNLVLWEPTQGRASRGGQSLTFIDQLLRDTSLKTAAHIRTCMEDRDVWRVIVAREDSTRVSVLLHLHKHLQCAVSTENYT